MATDAPETTKSTSSGCEEPTPAASDRRFYRRYPVAVPSALAIGDEQFDCAITDLSLGGVAVIPGKPDWCGRECFLHCDDFFFEPGMRGKVVRATDEILHISFDLDENMESALTMFLVMNPATR